MVLGNHYHHMFVLCSVVRVEYVCFVFCRLGGRVVLGNHYHHIVNGVCLFCVL